MYERNVFINCPFDYRYTGLFRSIVFTVQDCGMIARCALEASDSATVRIQKISVIIQECMYGIHDLSRTELDEVNNLPRFNMPLELGLFLGAKTFGPPLQRQKKCLILDTEKYRYQKFCSDIAGQDIYAHGDKIENAVLHVRNWLQSHSVLQGKRIPSGPIIYERFVSYQNDLSVICKKHKQKSEELTFFDYTDLVKDWLQNHQID